MCVRVARGCRHIDDGPATPQADPLSCVTRSQTLSVYTSDPSRHTARPLPTPPQWCPQESVTPAGNSRTKAASQPGGGGARLALWSDRLLQTWWEIQPEVRGQRGHDQKSQLTSSSLDPSSVDLTKHIYRRVNAGIWSQVTKTQSDKSHSTTQNYSSVRVWFHGWEIKTLSHHSHLQTIHFSECVLRMLICDCFKNVDSFDCFHTREMDLLAHPVGMTEKTGGRD